MKYNIINENVLNYNTKSNKNCLYAFTEIIFNWFNILYTY